MLGTNGNWKIIGAIIGAIILVIIGGYGVKNLNGVVISPTVGAIVALCVIVPYFMWISILGTSKANNPEWYKNPFGLPQGSIRAIITLVFVITALLSVQSKEFQMNQWLVGIIGTIIGFYFGERKSENTGDQNLKNEDNGLKEENDNLKKECEHLKDKLERAK